MQGQIVNRITSTNNSANTSVKNDRNLVKNGSGVNIMNDLNQSN